METKPRILCLLRLLETYTDEDHQLTTNELLDLLEDEYKLRVHRVTFKRDIESLQKMGLDIIETRSSQNRYFLGSRKFEIPELKLLIDAVESSKFITTLKSDTLIKKINGLVSVHQAKRLKRNNYVVKTVKPDNEQIYYIVDTVNDAINDAKQISFQYYDYTESKQKILKNDGETYIISPYYFVWNEDFYYLLGYSEKHKKVTTFRVDRIATVPKILPAPCYPKPRDFDLNEFTKMAFSMFDGDKTEVDLQCDNTLMKTIIDKFGEGITVLAYDDNSFHVTTYVETSYIFYGWIFGFNGKIRILGPECIKNQYKQMVKKALENI